MVSKKRVWRSDDRVIISWVFTALKADSQGISSFYANRILSEGLKNRSSVMVIKMAH